MNSIWQQCISCLEGEIDEQQLNTWILPLQVEQDPNNLKLLAPNRFVMDWVRKHFLERIRELVVSLDDSSPSRQVRLVAFGTGTSRKTATHYVISLKDAWEFIESIMEREHELLLPATLSDPVLGLLHLAQKLR